MKKHIDEIKEALRFAKGEMIHTKGNYYSVKKFNRIESLLYRHYAENFYALLDALKDMMAQARGLPKSCGHDAYCVCPFDNADKAIEAASFVEVEE